MPRAFSELEKERIGQRLLEQGSRLFSTYGLKKTNVEEITGAVGISKGAFYAFYNSKEALFMDVMEMTEVRLRREILAVVGLPGPSPRARLTAILKRGFSAIHEIPLLQFITGGDFDLLFSRIPAEKIQEHVANDFRFLDELIAACQAAGIPIQRPASEIVGLLYPLVLSLLHADDFGRGTITAAIDVHLELVAAYCLGEIEVHPDAVSTEGSQK